MIKEEALKILKGVFGENLKPHFKQQIECIESVFSNHRTLIVQKTGWGKSAVYFTCTRINRNKGKGVTLVISPLLSLIDNQIEAAKKFGLVCEKIDSSVSDSVSNKKLTDLINRLKNNDIDILFITPESLFSKLEKHLPYIDLGMFVIDEAHCISDWGHDFRLCYFKLINVLTQLNKTGSSFPILATTATANNYVIKDLEKQIGPNLHICRGSLVRDNLFLQTIELKSKLEKSSWILQHINDFFGTGIIYCLTTRDCEFLSDLLKANNISAAPYHSNLDEEIAKANLRLFSNNAVKVLISTVKLGMGYDKEDVSFIIHYQMPKNLIVYYQQIGRAGRNINVAATVILKSNEDEQILNYFVERAFPEEKTMLDVLKVFDDKERLLASSLPFGLDKVTVTHKDIEPALNYSAHDINHALKFLEFEGMIQKEKNHYFKTRSVDQFKYNGAHYSAIRKMRYNQINMVKSLFSAKSCLNGIILRSLDEDSIKTCKLCSNCIGDKISREVSNEYIDLVRNFRDNHFLAIKLKNKTIWRRYKDQSGKFNNEIINELIEGKSLCKYGEEGLGEIVADCKKQRIDYPNEVLDKMIFLFEKEDYINKFNLSHITFVPSLNNKLMDNFVAKLAESLNLKVIKCFEKITNIEQKKFKNSYLQKENAERNYKLVDGINVKDINIVVIDDMIDSGYTLSSLGRKLMKEQAKNILCLAIADTSSNANEENNDDLA